MAFIPSRYDCPLLRSIHFSQNSKSTRKRQYLSFNQGLSSRRNSGSINRFTPIHSKKLSEDKELDTKRKIINLNSVKKILIMKNSINKITQKNNIETADIIDSFRTIALTINREKILPSIKNPSNQLAGKEFNQRVIKINNAIQTSCQTHEGYEEILCPWNNKSKSNIISYAFFDIYHFL